MLLTILGRSSLIWYAWVGRAETTLGKGKVDEAVVEVDVDEAEDTELLVLEDAALVILLLVLVLLAVLLAKALWRKIKPIPRLQ